MSRCPTCGTIDPSGCNCSVCDSDCFTINGSGDDGSCFSVEPVLDEDTDNILSCSAAGLMATLPDYILDPPACRVYNSAVISIPNDTATGLTFDSDDYDTDTMHAIAGRITFTTAGVYTVVLDVLWDKNDTGDRAIYVKLNGTDFIGIASVHAGDPDLYVGQSLTVPDEFAAGDYVEAFVKQDSGGSLNILSESGSPAFSATFKRRPTS